MEPFAFPSELRGVFTMRGIEAGLISGLLFCCGGPQAEVREEVSSATSARVRLAQAFSAQLVWDSPGAVLRLRVQRSDGETCVTARPPPTWCTAGPTLRSPQEISVSRGRPAEYTIFVELGDRPVTGRLPVRATLRLFCGGMLRTEVGPLRVDKIPLRVPLLIVEPLSCRAQHVPPISLVP
jgi:hypothetical protein